MHNLTRITFNHEVMGGKPCIRGMRVTVGTIVGLIGAGKTIDDVLKEYPYLEQEDVLQACHMPLGGPKNGKCRWPCNENFDRHEFAAPVGQGICRGGLGGTSLVPGGHAHRQ